MLHDSNAWTSNNLRQSYFNSIIEGAKEGLNLESNEDAKEASHFEIDTARFEEILKLKKIKYDWFHK